MYVCLRVRACKRVLELVSAYPELVCVCVEACVCVRALSWCVCVLKRVCVRALSWCVCVLCVRASLSPWRPAPPASPPDATRSGSQGTPRLAA